jgi:hypothetical protein
VRKDFMTQVQMVIWSSCGDKSLLICFGNSDNLSDLEVMVSVGGFGRNRGRAEVSRRGPEEGRGHHIESTVCALSSFCERRPLSMLFHHCGPNAGACPARAA